jgi:hypothetical protein
MADRHEHLRKKAHAKIAGKKGKEKIQAFLDNLVEDAEAFRQSAEGMTKEQILEEGTALIATMKANNAEFTEALSK